MADTTPVFYAVLLRDRAYTVDADTVSALHTAIKQRASSTTVTLPHHCCGHSGTVEIALADIRKIVCLSKIDAPPWSAPATAPAASAQVIMLDHFRRPLG
jgi:hypothetical protein